MICLLAKCAFIVIRETWLMASHVFWTEPLNCLEQHCQETCDPCENSSTSATHFGESRTSVDKYCPSCLSICQEQQGHRSCHCQTDCEPKKESKSFGSPSTNAATSVSTISYVQQSKSTETSPNRRRSEGTQASDVGKSRKTNTSTSSKSIASVSSQSPRTTVENGSQSLKTPVDHRASQSSVHSTTGTNPKPMIRYSKGILTEEGRISDGMPPGTPCSQSEVKCSPETGTTSVHRKYSNIKQSGVLDEDDFLKEVASELGREPKRIQEESSETFVTCQSSPASLQREKNLAERIEESSAVSSQISKEFLQKQGQNWSQFLELPEQYQFELWTVVYALVFIFLLLHLVFICYHHCALQNIRDSVGDGKSFLKEDSRQGSQGLGNTTNYRQTCRQNVCKHRTYDCTWCPRNHAHQEGSSYYIIA